jgi:hypothetical protein
MNEAATGLAARLVGETMTVMIDSKAITLTMPDASTVVAATTVEADQTLIDALTATGIKPEGLDSAQSQFVDDNRQLLAKAASRLVCTIKFYLDNTKVSESRLANYLKHEWSVNGTDWNHCPLTIEFGNVSAFTTPAYSGNLAQQVTAAVAKDNPPVLIHAMRFLHRAKLEFNPQHRWIDATIAAEIGIKEFLVTFKPGLAPLLLDIPSPPLKKLYGDVLEAYTGQRSPMLSKLHAGVEMRNKLVHQPAHQEITTTDALQYVYDVELALLHLTLLLYPDDTTHAYMQRCKQARPRREPPKATKVKQPTQPKKTT